MAIKELSKNIVNLTNTIGKNYNNLNSSLKEMKSTQNNIVNNISNNQNNSQNNMQGSTNNQQGAGNIIPNVRTDKPLPQDFPSGITPEGSNLANR